MKKLLYISFIFFIAGLTYAQPVDVLVNWECNMEFELLSGRFSTSDTVAARGDFNSWGRHDLVPDIDPNYYVSTVPDTVMQVEVGDTIVYYKFFYTPAVWEVFADNRMHVLTQAEYDAGEVYISHAFNDGSITTLVNQESHITFNVDVSNAVSSVNGQPFPAINSVVIAGGVAPLQWPGGGWPNGDIGLTIPLSDMGSGIWSATITFPIYSPFEIPYKYGINYADTLNNGGGNDNEAGVGDNHIVTLWASFTDGVVNNVFGTMGNHLFVGVKDITNNTITTAYSLKQNYPNPFNPYTKIQFSIPEEGMVSLTVFNAIGQQVATLVNERKSVGTYEVGFNAENLTSGIYFYKINVGNFSETKKMILMK